MALYGNDKVKLEFLSSGFKALLMSNEVRNEIYQAAEGIARDAGYGFAAHVFYGRGKAGRVMATVDAETPEARRLEATDKVLTRAATRQRGA